MASVCMLNTRESNYDDGNELLIISETMWRDDERAVNLEALERMLLMLVAEWMFMQWQFKTPGLKF